MNGQRVFKLTNDLHNTVAIVKLSGESNELSRHQARRIRLSLCGPTGCTCGGPLGVRGPQAEATVAMETWNHCAPRYVLVPNSAVASPNIL